jgi:predicted transcriptional regulator of viral defense system
VARIEQLEDFPADIPFDYQLAMDRLRSFQAPRDKLRLLCERGDLVRVKKGLYVPGWRQGQPSAVDPLVLAALIYGPSYVSLETALAYHGLIPERVEEITSVSTKRAREFQTPLGRFTYRPVNERVFSYGVRLEHARGGTFFLAEPEKALCDRIALIQDLSAAREVEIILADDLRVDLDALRSFRLSMTAEIAWRYRRKNVSAFHQWLGRYLT